MILEINKNFKELYIQNEDDTKKYRTPQFLHFVIATEGDSSHNELITDFTPDDNLKLVDL